MPDIPNTSLSHVLKQQYHACLAMLREAIERCPQDQWDNTPHTNQFWQIAYHALYFAHLYSQVDEASFVPWKDHQADTQNPDGMGGPHPDSTLPIFPKQYTKGQVLEYWKFCDDSIDGFVDVLDLASPNSGFEWYKISKLEHQLVNIRHIQHHAAQLGDRLRAVADIGITWVGSGRRKKTPQ